MPLMSFLASCHPLASGYLPYSLLSGHLRIFGHPTYQGSSFPPPEASYSAEKKIFEHLITIIPFAAPQTTSR
ncbi:uncharacterized protein EI97DRAFT_438030 [Westerdykella ornata]|uniref:Uncharacterized protein n=1 Tax=Westerdykella ornata TaxID=318751 RepID=A0A6A6J3U5_WESOR|nr:uncharacterized protein EI97DRAFT_438030 [Westerdykella ornata]KAF2271241.1 hypothetical protein EI97DRAFT_438030 [Westerdykella ornata]